MPESDWIDRAVSDCLEDSFAGEWGSKPNPGNALVLRATDIDDAGHVVGAGAPRCVPMSKLCAKRLQDGDVLLEGSGGGPGKPVGRVALFEADSHDGPAICSNFFKTLRPKRSVVDQRFLWRKLGWFYTQPALLALQQQTTGIINLKFVEYLAARLRLPADLHEQAKIAEVLDTLDTTIRQTEAIIEKLKQVKQGLLHDLLTRGIDANGELRPPQIEAPHLYKESPLGWIPREWSSHLLGEVIGHLMDYRGRTPKKLGMEWGGGDILALSANNVQMGGIDASREAYVGSDKLYARWMTNGDPVKGDVLMTLEAPLGNVAQVPDSRRYILSQRVILLRFMEDEVKNNFAFWQLISDRFQRAMVKLSTGSTATGIQRAKLVMIPFAVPPSAEQQAIDDRLRAIETRLATERASAHKLELGKAGLTDDLLTGRVRVTPLL